jgi:hypothetical protein
MDYVAVPVNRDADAHATVRTFTDAACVGDRGRIPHRILEAFTDSKVSHVPTSN